MWSQHVAAPHVKARGAAQLTLLPAQRLPVERRQADLPVVARITTHDAVECSAKEACHDQRRERATLNTARLAVACADTILPTATADDTLFPSLWDCLANPPQPKKARVPGAKRRERERGERSGGREEGRKGEEEGKGEGGRGEGGGKSVEIRHSELEGK